MDFSPLSFVLGVAGALLVVLFFLRARAQARSYALRPTPKAPGFDRPRSAFQDIADRERAQTLADLNRKNRTPSPRRETPTHTDSPLPAYHPASPFFPAYFDDTAASNPGSKPSPKSSGFQDEGGSSSSKDTSSSDSSYGGSSSSSSSYGGSDSGGGGGD
jgi:hypothetical protein